MERRALERVVIPQAQVYYKYADSSLFFSRSTGPVALINLNKSGACFEVREGFPVKQQFNLRIKISGEKVLKVKGQVRWCSYAERPDRNRVGVQFLPYGKRRIYNTPDTLNRLRRITEQYQSLSEKL
jgi:hypothetical protein